MKRKEDIYCENGRNILWDKDRVEAVLRKTRLTQADNNRRQLVGNLNGRLYLLCDALP